MTRKPALNTRRRRLLQGAAGTTALTVIGAPGLALAQGGEWPAKAVRIVVPFAAGGLNDVYARMYGEFMARKFSQSFVIDNRTGAGGTIGVDAVAKAPPDGYTLLVTTTGTIWTVKDLYNRVPYDPARDLVPISLFPSGPLVLAVPQSSPYKTMNDMLDAARAGQVNLGTYAQGSLPHLMCETWNKADKTHMTAIHYKGESPMFVDLASGQIQAGVGSYNGFAAYQAKGMLRAIGVTGSVRSPKLPDVPTLVEQGAKAPLFGLDGWMPFMAPTNTPAEILAKLSAAVAEAAETPKLKSLRETYGITMLPTSPAETRERWAKESVVWSQAAAALGIKLD